MKRWKQIWILPALPLFFGGVARVNSSVGENENLPQESQSETLYQQHCAVCHGVQGKGDGPAAYLLRPRPRDFRLGAYRLVSTQNGIATKEDILKTLNRGMPGTGMPSWAHLPQEQLDTLAAYVLELSRQGLVERLLATAKAEDEELSVEQAQTLAAERLKPGEKIRFKAEPSMIPEDIEKGRLLFVSTCAKCHGSNGAGMSDPAWRNAEGYPIWSRNLLSGAFKGGRESESIFCRIRGGIPGTPMPSHAQFSDEQTWSLVHYVQSLSNPANQTLAEVRQEHIQGRRLENLPAAPQDPIWDSLPATRVTLMPLFWRDQFRDAVTVRAAHDGKTITFLLEWLDETQDIGGLGQREFPDACALAHSAEREAPLFTMGDAKHPVNIWHWKALWSQDEMGFQDINQKWPNAHADLYYGRPKGYESGPLEDQLYRPALNGKNWMATEKRPSPVEDCNAARFGSLTTQAPEDQNVQGLAVYSDGVWRVQISREMNSPGKLDTPFQPGGQTFLALAIWNGSIGDRDGQKSISVWNILKLDP